MSPTSSLIHALKDQMRSVKYSIRAEAYRPGSMVPRALQSREVRRLTALGGVVTMPAFRLVDGIVTRVETIAMDWIGAAPRRDHIAIEPVATYVAGGFEASDKLFSLLKRIVDIQDCPNVFVSEQALEPVAGIVAKALPQGSAGVDDQVLATAILADALARANPIRCVGYRPGEPETNFAGAPSLYCGLVAGLMIAVASERPSSAEDGEALLESADSAVNARFDRFRRAIGAEAIAAEYRRLIPFLP